MTEASFVNFLNFRPQEERKYRVEKLIYYHYVVDWEANAGVRGGIGAKKEQKRKKGRI